MRDDPLMPRLATDGRMLGAPGSGVATYARALREAQRLITGDSILLCDRSGGMRLPTGDGRVARWLRAAVPVAARARVVGEHLVGRDLFRLAQIWFDVQRRLLPVRVPGPPGLIHWSYPLPIRLVGWANVYTVHDAIPLHAPALSPIDAVRHRRLLRAVAAEAARSGVLATVSAAARAEIVAALGCDPALVADASEALPAPVAAGPLPPGLVSRNFLLVCGSVEARKNIARIVAAYRASGVAMPLVVAGRDGWRAAELRDLLAATAGVVRLPHVDDATMAALLGQARALVMPSLAEGFGLPLVEAMARGTPVLASAGGALAETAGGAALLVDPLDPAAIAAGIARLCADDASCARLAAAGHANAARFTLDAFAARLAPLYAAAIARRDGLAYRGPGAEPG